MSETLTFANAISPGELRTFAGHFATGVAVVTTTDPGGALHGVTITAVTSLSLEPPLFLICLDQRSNTLAALLESGHFVLHFLSREQAAISRVFASKQSDKFAEIRHRPGRRGSPIIEDVVAAAECSIREVCPGGDHSIIIGAVDHVHVHGGEPLLYHRGAYAALECERKVA
ncbi:flavin reductase family protein [Ancylobacter sp. MQZ15Z-1]|uniref:Flavin reductase family protein n=1 Tax=Ancylobacter mangrovi TaxID=2972472 RepID=A0A9X2T192_9HYPH|nr:flavin reductase family protein [Ancylobacter mangrovi]MCS0494765.1 flavin reductase family protein [Ancylobacter mangrovi]